MYASIFGIFLASQSASDAIHFPSKKKSASDAGWTTMI
jgi:hypothetical protein